MAGSNMYRGTLDLIILQTLKPKELHGYAIRRKIEERSEGSLEVDEGVLYPALRRLESRGWIEGHWGETATGRKARFYELTPEGSAALERERTRWEQHTEGVFSILRQPGG